MVKKLIINNCIFLCLAFLIYFFINLGDHKFSLSLVLLPITNNIFLIYLFRKKHDNKNTSFCIAFNVVLYIIYFITYYFLNKYAVSFLQNILKNNNGIYENFKITSIYKSLVQVALLLLWVLFFMISIKPLFKDVKFKSIYIKAGILFGIYGLIFILDNAIELLITKICIEQQFFNLRYTYIIGIVYIILSYLLRSFFITYISINIFKLQAYDQDKQLSTRAG